MKIVSAAFLIILVVTLPAFSQRRQNNERANGVPDRTSVSGFGARIVVVQNPREFVQEWLKPEIPKIKHWSVTDVKRGDSLGAFVLLIGCTTDPKGVCHSEVDYAIYKPDGGIYAERKRQQLLQEKTPPPPNIQVGTVIPDFHMGKDDPAGEYRVKARISDLNANVSLELETRFRLK